MAKQYKTGDRVLLKHDAGQKCLTPYVGMVATITVQYARDSEYFATDVSSHWWWPSWSFGSPIFNPDQKCCECGTSAPHEECKADTNYTCAFCAAVKELDA